MMHIKFTRVPSGFQDEPKAITVALPARAEQIAAALRAAGNIHLDDPIVVWETIFPQMPALLNLVKPATFREANILASRLAQMEEYEQAELEAFALQHLNASGRSTVDCEYLINLTYHLNTCVHGSGVRNDIELGKFIIENGMDERFFDVAETDLADMLYEKIGREWRESEDGVFHRYGYSCQTELPESLPHPYHRVVNTPQDQVRYVISLTTKQVEELCRLMDGQNSPIVNSIRQQLERAVPSPQSNTGIAPMTVEQVAALTM